jgi:uncharacterized membrane protein YfcA
VAISTPAAVGAFAGGFGGAAAARRVGPKGLRRLVLFFASALTAWFFVRAQST